MSNQEVINAHSRPPLSGGDFVVPKPGAAHTMAGALNHAFDRIDVASLPDEWIDLLNRIEAGSGHFDGE